jgi:protein TonB
MQKTFTTINPGLLGAILISLLLHGSLLGVKAFQRPAIAEFDSGDISVELTLVPSIASVAATKPVPVEPEPLIEREEPIAEVPVPTATEPEMIQPPAIPEPTQPEPFQEPSEPAIKESANSIDQDGSPEEDKGAFSEAQTQSRCTPIYPRISRRRGEEGIVMLSIDVSASGKGSNIQVIQSSGHTRLDKAAIKALEKADFTPAIRFGRPHASILIQTFNFRLNDA